MKKNRYILPAMLAAAVLGGCGKLKLLQEPDAQLREESSIQKENSEKGQTTADETAGRQQAKTSDSGGDGQQAETPDSGGDGQQENIVQEPEILHFVDAFGESYQVEINPRVEKHDYRMESFIHNGDRLSYEGDDRYDYRLGVDVSHHNGEVDWYKVKAAGYEFAFLRLGYRGYGQAGNVCLDRQFHHNIQNAAAAGMDIGVYFFSQAVNEEEAEEEAAFVLKNLQGYDLQLPVVYDPESILDAEARTDHVTGRQFTKNTITFCRQIAKAGYQPMIYSNMLWEAYQFDLEQLSEYPVWYADYEKLPQTPYAFQYWQYSSEGIVDGIDGAVDLNIQLME